MTSLGVNNYYSIASDSTGTNLALSSLAGGAIYISTSGGSTWTTVSDSLAEPCWYGISSDSTGQFLVSVQNADVCPGNPGGIYISTSG